MRHAQLVTLADVEPHGWNCEGCNREFKPGHLAYGEWTGMVEDDPLYSNWVCSDCEVKYGSDEL